MAHARGTALGSRRGGAALIALTIGGVLLLAANAFLGKQNSDMEKDALRRTQEVAENTRAQKASEQAQEAVVRDTKQLQYNEVSRAVNLITPAGGPITDLVDLSFQADESTKVLAKRLYGDHVSTAQQATVAEQASSARARIGRTNPGLAENNSVVASLVIEDATAKEQLSKPETVANLRRRFPEQYAGLKDDAQVRDKYLQGRFQATIAKANSAYEYAQSELRRGGNVPTPAQINAVVAKLFTGSQTGDNKEAFQAALKQATLLQNVYGTYTGRFSGGAEGKCAITLSSKGASASFTGAGRTGTMGSFTVRVTGNGSFDSSACSVNGSLKGSLTWVIPTYALMGTSPVGGSFAGKVAPGVITGRWSATSSREARSGEFTATK